MSKITYVPRKLSASSLEIVDQANDIIDEYQQQGFNLTLRQLYYQFVSRDFVPNNQKEYKRLGSVINDARLAGLIDWEAIVDRTRELRALAHWDSPADIVAACARQFRMDKWRRQPTYVEVWIEKDALIGVIEKVCQENDVPYFSCRGYTSQSEMWSAAQRLIERCTDGGPSEDGQDIHIIHLGDHDPSGIDMSRDIEDRLDLFLQHVDLTIEGNIERIALNMDQVKKYNPPPNPAKLTDSRSESYVKKFGDDSWELDALDPKTLATLIQKAINRCRDDDEWERCVQEENECKAQLVDAAERLRAD